MVVIKIVWIIANTIAAAHFSSTFLVNSIYPANYKWVRFVDIMISPVVLFFFHGVIAVAMCLFASIATAVIITSFVGYGWALIAYFLFQRFADSLERPGLALEHPMFQPLGAFGGFLSSTFAISFFAGWWLMFLPFVLWLLLGFLCAEVAIRRLMRGDDGYDRRLAIFALNMIQGRLSGLNYWFGKIDRYPFP
ncbi:MAG: hypothetical protein FVQ80_09745 [Planctomycetes bacterium]|nr:hypothetical protein [Planctomycetota bacterium]